MSYKSMRVLDLRDGMFVLTCLYVDKEIAKSVPGARWNPNAKQWEYPVSYEVYEALRTRLGNLEVTKAAHAAAMKAAIKMADRMQAKNGTLTDTEAVRESMPIRTKAFHHQVMGFALACQVLGLEVKQHA